MTNLEPPKEHDLTGLRDNFNPKARWKAAIAGARALHRFGNSRSSSNFSKSSGGWGSVPDDSDDDDDEVISNSTADGASQVPLREQEHEHNEHVQVTPPEDERPKTELPATVPTEVVPPAPTPSSVPAPTSSPAPAPAPAPVSESPKQTTAQQSNPQPSEQKDTLRPDHTGDDGYDSDTSLAIPGSFSTKKQPGDAAHSSNGNEEHHGSWATHAAHLFRKLRL